MSSLRIAFVLTRFPSGSETFVATQVEGLLARGHTVDVFAAEQEEGLSARATSVIRPLRFGETLRGGRWRAAARILTGLVHAQRWRAALRYGYVPAVTAFQYGAALSFRTATYDVVHCHFGPNGILGAAMRAARVLDGPLVVTFHGYDMSAQLRRSGPDAYRRLFGSAELCLPVTDRWRQRLIELGADPDRVIVHRMGVDRAAFVTQHTPPAPGGPLRVLMTARLVEKKGTEYAIRAIAEARDADVQLTIAGDGPLMPRLERLARSLAVHDRVAFIGWQSPAAVRQLLRESDVFLLPSVTAADGDEEGLPVSLMEAMAAGLPVITTRHSGIPELVREGMDGLLVGERDPAALAAALRTMAGDADARRRMGASGRARVAELHDNDELNDRLVTIYDAVAAGGPLPASVVQYDTALRA